MEPDVLFFACPNTSHSRVRWEGATAICEECGLTSDQVKAIVDRGRADQRQLDILALRAAVLRARAASRVLNDADATDEELAPATLAALRAPVHALEAAAEFLTLAPLGPPSPPSPPEPQDNGLVTPVNRVGELRAS